MVTERRQGQKGISSQAMEPLAASLLPEGSKVHSITQVQSLWAGFGYVYSVIADIPCSRLQTANGREGEGARLILKYVGAPVADATAEMNEGDLRKIYSYEVEQYFYSVLVPYMLQHTGADIAVADCVGNTRPQRIAALQKQAGQSLTQVPIALMLSDLRPRFPRSPSKRGLLDEAQAYAAIRWLARFHSFWMHKGNDAIKEMLRNDSLCRPPLSEARRRRASPEVTWRASVWLNGGYT
ncbi:hypothetical protein K437DRAFT_257561 [Tilletiaria anomala UBC 951]|uniref:Uncharacterized protein n=1 Tax=Tilletiaria anomala (strain ATCC 24038 / CBS 436.72 / UBC 951) TaxID=1037660 RepID=A0A066VNZ8_TILAU|nr:uncharacterized protein K437DRAFT_257561 [Tilletiaria anomala UBC 951]KDN43191.1 hypothetical protein K437DRAFT_257561 [Tilletiaria anomala UBC 951]